MIPDKQEPNSGRVRPDPMDRLVDEFHSWDGGRRHIGIEDPDGTVQETIDYPIDDFYAERLELLSRNAGSRKLLIERRKAAVELVGDYWGDIDSEFESCMYVLSCLQEAADRETDQVVLAELSTILFDVIFADNLKGEEEIVFTAKAAKVAAALLAKDVPASRGEANPECILLKLAEERAGGRQALSDSLRDVVRKGSSSAVVDALTLLHDKKLNYTDLGLASPDCALASITLSPTKPHVNRAYDSFINYFGDDEILKEVLIAASILGRYGPQISHVAEDFKGVEGVEYFTERYFQVSQYTSKKQSVVSSVVKKIEGDSTLFELLTSQQKERVLASWYKGLLPGVNPNVQRACAKAICEHRTDESLAAELPTISALLNCPGISDPSAHALLHILANSSDKHPGAEYALAKVRSKSDFSPFAVGVAAYAKMRHQTASPRLLLLELELTVSCLQPKNSFSRSVLANCRQILPQISSGPNGLHSRDFKMLSAKTAKKLREVLAEVPENSELIEELALLLTETPTSDPESADILNKILYGESLAPPAKLQILTSLEENRASLSDEARYRLWGSLRHFPSEEGVIGEYALLVSMKLWEPSLIINQLDRLGSGLLSVAQTRSFLEELSVHMFYAENRSKDSEELLRVSGYCAAEGTRLAENSDDHSPMRQLGLVLARAARRLEKRARGLRVI